MFDPLKDRPRLPDPLVCALDYASSPEEHAFSLAMNFHGNVLNGGLNQALFNLKPQVADVIFAFRQMEMAPIANLVLVAQAVGHDRQVWLEVYDEEPHPLDGAYIAATYDLGYACNDNIQIEEFNAGQNLPDWVDRMALRYARKNRSQFKRLIDEAIRIHEKGN